ncbi:hypothetical protein CFO_g4880 [Ceratocystis platani]|uniref:Uncharacterized protein n=1 Tax=Ceratocystis fimbriata f. sp. platani TaxID=88771 RepID=A0A0F8B088_CERFI|nr:hypothetical protein CFO_g4880 [Ceratocystis platani]
MPFGCLDEILREVVIISDDEDDEDLSTDGDDNSDDDASDTMDTDTLMLAYVTPGIPHSTDTGTALELRMMSRPPRFEHGSRQHPIDVDDRPYAQPYRPHDYKAQQEPEQQQVQQHQQPSNGAPVVSRPPPSYATGSETIRNAGIAFYQDEFQRPVAPQPGMHDNGEWTNPHAPHVHRIHMCFFHFSMVMSSPISPGDERILGSTETENERSSVNVSMRMNASAVDSAH